MANREMMALTGSELEPGMASADESSQENTRFNGRRVAVAAGFGLAFLGLLAAFVAAGGSAALMGSKMDNLGVKTAVTPLYVNGVPAGVTVYKPTEGVYNLKSARNGFYINVDGGKRQNEANVQLWNNPTSPHSRWFITPAVTPGVFNLQYENDRTYSMNLEAGGADNKTNVQIYENPESSDSQWQFYKIGTSNNYLIKSTKGHLYVGATGDAIGASVTVNEDPSGAENQWHLELVAGTTTPTTGTAPTGTSLVKPAECTYNIMNSAESMYVNVEAAAKAKESNVQLYNNPGKPETQWTIRRTGTDSGIYTIASVNAATQYLNVEGGGRAESNYSTNVQIYSNPQSPDSQWIFYLESASNKYLIKNLATQQFLSAGGQTIESNLQVTSGLSNFAATRWVLKSITCAPAANPTTVTTTTTSTTTKCTATAGCATGETCVSSVCKCGSNAACATDQTCTAVGTGAVCMCGAFAACGTGETCDKTGTAPICKCGTAAACTGTTTCTAATSTCA